MPTNRADYMREYQRKLYEEHPEKARLIRSKKYCKQRYNFTSQETEEFGVHCVRAGKIRELFEEIGNAELAFKVCEKYLNLECLN